ncbi:MAG: BMP family ABC transporter substrate-binding protein [Actinobacteria bacterium]|nr:BMP family ABC transporter substrate-binding protein [Actinomycetota bacterium]
MRSASVAVLVVVVSLLASGCGSGSSSATGGSTGGGGEVAGGGKLACLVTSGSGVSDHSFNQAAWTGVKAGAEAKGLEPRYAQAESSADYQSAASAFTKQPCALIVTNGFAMADATETVATEDPSSHFAIVDFGFEPQLPNVQGLQFNAAEAAFLAGFAAAGYSKTGVVATYGGEQQPPLTLYMDGYVDGVDYYNKTHGTQVKVLGWNKASQSGTFVGSFTDQAKGEQIVNDFIGQGADVILTLGGLANEGALAAVEHDNGQAKLIWDDTDGCVEQPSACKSILTSAMKNISVATQQAVEGAAEGHYDNSNYVGTLANNGVGIASFRGQISSALEKEVEAVKQKIIDGEVKVESPSTPHG